MTENWTERYIRKLRRPSGVGSWLDSTNWDFSDQTIRYKVWRNAWLYLLLGWATKNSLNPTSDLSDLLYRRLWVRVSKGLFYDVVVFL